MNNDFDFNTMTEKLTYEKFCDKFTITISDEARNALKEIHNLDPDSEIESAKRKHYDLYIKAYESHQGKLDNE